jgi:hypothetical protein
MGPRARSTRLTSRHTRAWRTSALQDTPARLSCVATLTSDYTPSSGRCSPREREPREERGVPCPGVKALRSHGFLLEHIYDMWGMVSSRSGVWGRDLPAPHSHKERPFIPWINARGFLGRRSVTFHRMLKRKQNPRCGDGKKEESKLRKRYAAKHARFTRFCLLCR